MKFVFASYVFVKDFNEPEAWLHRVRAYGGILEALGASHEVISIEQIDYEGKYVKNGVNYQFMKLPESDHYLPRKLHRAIKEINPDVVVIHGMHNPLQVMQLRLKLGRKTKIILQNHAEKPFQGLKKYLQRWADHTVDAVLFASHAMGADWVSQGNLNSVQKIHEVMEVSSIFQPLAREKAVAVTGVTGHPVFLWAGRLNQNKDPLLVIGAFLKHVMLQPEARLYMIYHTDELLEEIMELLSGHPLREAIVLVGKVPHDEMLYWLNSADFILSGSHYEGSGTAVCEAMSCGCIPVVTDIFSFRMMTDNGKCGILYEPGNEAALLSALQQIQQADLREKRELSLSYFKENLSFEAIARRFGEIAASL